MQILAGNSSKLDSVLALNKGPRQVPLTLPVVNPIPGPTQPNTTNTTTTTIGAKLNPFASLAAPAKSVLRGNPLATVMNGHASYDMFQNATDGSISPAPHSSVGTVATQQPESEALFQDFALSAFNDFKKDLSNSTVHRRSAFGGASKTTALKAAEFGTGGKGAPINTDTVGTHNLNGARVIMANGTLIHEKVAFFLLESLIRNTSFLLVFQFHLCDLCPGLSFWIFPRTLCRHSQFMWLHA